MHLLTPGKALILAAFFLSLLLLVATAALLDLPFAADRMVVSAVLAGLALATAGAGLLAYRGHRQVVSWLELTSVNVALANQGDLTVPLPTADAAGAAAMALYGEISGLMAHFRTTIANLQATAATIAAMSAQMNDNSMRLVGTVEKQANGAIDTTATVAEISMSIEQTVSDIEKLTRSSREVTTAIMEMAANVEEVALSMSRLMEAIDQVSASIAELTASTHEIDGNVETLNSNTLNAASSIAEMDHSIKQVQDSARSAVAFTSAVLQDAEAGKHAVDATIAKSSQIQHSSMVALAAIDELSRRAASIDAIIRVIDEVAEQTNLLALNASIIAAQAGEQGRGFAVVADEIKGLAQKTKHSTHEIYEIIEGVQSETRRVDEVIRATEGHVRDGVELSTFSGNALEKIVAGMRQVNTQVALIARATEEQATGSHGLRKSMENVSAMVTQIAGAAHGQSAASDLIHASTESMRNLAVQINAATREQSTASAVIAKLAEVMRNLMENARDSCREQLQGSARISAAVEIILETSDLNLDVARGMDEAVEKLGRHAEELQRVNDFTL